MSLFCLCKKNKTLSFKFRLNKTIFSWTKNFTFGLLFQFLKEENNFNAS
jgi:hypothetical protein